MTADETENYEPPPGSSPWWKPGFWMTRKEARPFAHSVLAGVTGNIITLILLFTCYRGYESSRTTVTQLLILVAIVVAATAMNVSGARWFLRRKRSYRGLRFRDVFVQRSGSTDLRELADVAGDMLATYLLLVCSWVSAVVGAAILLYLSGLVIGYFAKNQTG